MACPIEAGHHASIKCDLFLQSAADSLDNIPFDLRLNSFRIDDLSAIMNNIDPGHPDTTDRPVDFYFDDDANIGAHQFVFDVTNAASLHDITGDVLLGRRPLLGSENAEIEKGTLSATANVSAPTLGDHFVKAGMLKLHSLGLQFIARNSRGPR